MVLLIKFGAVGFGFTACVGCFMFVALVAGLVGCLVLVIVA